MSWKIIVLVVAVVLGFIAWQVFDLGSHLGFAQLQAHQEELHAWVAGHWLLAVLGYAGIYILVTGAGAPAAAVLTIAGGLLFGRWWGLLLASLGSTIGAALAFLVARYLLRDWLDRKAGPRLRRLRDGVDRDGASYLFSLRLIPIFPFWLINIGMATTRMKLPTFLLVSWIGMLPGTFVYVNAGTGLAGIDSPGDILSADVIGAFLLLAAFPLLLKGGRSWWRRRRGLRGHRRPARVDYDTLVIGAGAGGLVAAAATAMAGGKVALIERERMGGDCLHTGCVPSKTLLHVARRHRHAGGPVDHQAVRAAIAGAIAHIQPHDSPERYTGLGVDCIHGTARLVDPWTVLVGERRLTARSIIVATGASPVLPDWPGLATVTVRTSETLWDLERLPEHLVVIGTGPIGCELAQAFADLGSRVTMLGPERVLAKEDEAISALAAGILRGHGVELHIGPKAVDVARDDEGIIVHTDAEGEDATVRCDEVLVAIGRAPDTTGFGLEELGVERDEHGRIVVDERLRSSVPTIHAVGDCTSQLQFTHVAGQQGWRAAINALLGPLWSISGSLPAVPRCTYLDPEVASIGLTEAQARAQGVACELHTLSLGEVDRYVTEHGHDGCIRLLTRRGSDEIIGATMVGDAAGEVIGTISLAMVQHLGLKDLLAPVLPYPTRLEALQKIAGEFRRQRRPKRLLALAAGFWRWRRSRRRSLLMGWIATALLGLLVLAIVLAWSLLVPPAMPGVGGAPQGPGAGLLRTFDEQWVYRQAAVDDLDALLARHVDDRGLVDYPGLQQDTAALHRYLRSIAHLDPATFHGHDEATQKALWLNAYNAWMLALIAEHHPIGRTPGGWAKQRFSDSEIPPGSVLNLARPFAGTSMVVLGRELSFDRIEHHILRRYHADPRCHFALTCASLGCAPLRREAYRGERLDAQLADQARRFLVDNARTRVVIDRQDGTVTLNPILAWFAADFADRAPEDDATFASAADRAERGVLATIATHLDEADAGYLRNGRYRVVYRPYDWGLNAQEK